MFVAARSPSVRLVVAEPTRRPRNGLGYLITTGVPGSTRAASWASGAASTRTHPFEVAAPMLDGAFVPWIAMRKSLVAVGT